MLGALRYRAIRLEGFEHIQHVANIDVHDFHVDTRSDRPLL